MLFFLKRAHELLGMSRKFDFLAPLAIRLYLVPIMWTAGTKKFESFDSSVQWFGNSEWGLGLPFPEFTTAFVTGTEMVGAIFFLAGFAVRWISIPLFMTMVGAALTVHWQNGWLAIAEADGFFASERTTGAVERLATAKELLKMHGNYEWLTENGSFVILNNGIEFAATYAIMLLALFFIGAGRYVSADYWIARRWRSER